MQYDDPKKPVFRVMNKVATKNKFRPGEDPWALTRFQLVTWP